MDDIGNILSSLSESDMNKLKSIASSIMGNGAASANTENSAPEQNSSAGDIISSLGLSENSLAPIMNAVSQLNKKDDRTNFLNALKPLLSSPRQSKADEALKFLQLMRMLPLLKDSGIGSLLGLGK